MIQMKTIFVLSAFALGLFLCWSAFAYAPAIEPIPRPQPRPPMDCWINHDTGETECEVRK